MAKFYILERQPHPWGDYGHILMHGMSCHLGREGGLIQLERTGPFVPPISLPGIGDVVVTDAFRNALAESGLIGLRFQPVIKRLIVSSVWHTWDRDAPEPPEFPIDGEPESYVLAQPHSVAAANEMGEIWELLLSQNARVHRAKQICARDDIYLLTDSWQKEDLFRADGVGYIYATKRARDWMTEHAGEYVRFQEARIKASA